jgi:hypothetical protein
MQFVTLYEDTFFLSFYALEYGTYFTGTADLTYVQLYECLPTSNTKCCAHDLAKINICIMCANLKNTVVSVCFNTFAVGTYSTYCILLYLCRYIINIY